MKETLILSPQRNFYNNLLKNYHEGTPLNPDQVNFLDWHEKALSHYGLDHALHYYLKHHRDKKEKALEFLKRENINLITLRDLKDRIHSTLKTKQSVAFNLTKEEFIAFKTMLRHELVFWHGNYFFVDNSVYKTWFPHIIYFQWINLFGVAKVVSLSDTAALNGPLLIRFEEVRNRTFSQCITDHLHQFKEELQQNNIHATFEEHHDNTLELPTINLSISRPHP